MLILINIDYYFTGIKSNDGLIKKQFREYKLIRL